jgi:hypothetical protein
MPSSSSRSPATVQRHPSPWASAGPTQRPRNRHPSLCRSAARKSGGEAVRHAAVFHPGEKRKNLD